MKRKVLSYEEQFGFISVSNNYFCSSIWVYLHFYFYSQMSKWAGFSHYCMVAIQKIIGALSVAKIHKYKTKSLACALYRKFPKYSDTQKSCYNHSKIWTMWLYHREMSPNDADRMANSVDSDQTASLGAVRSGSALFAQAYLSKNLGSLRYIKIKSMKIW